MSEIEEYRKHGFHVFRDAMDCGMLMGIRSFLECSADLQPDDEMSRTGHFSLGTRLSERLLDIPKSNDLRWILRDVLESEELYMHMPPMARFVLPGNDAAAVPPHQDASYNTHMTDFVTVWIPLTPVNERCGGVAVYGEADVIPVARRAGEVWLDGIPVDGLNEVTFDMGVGDILVMNPRVIHKSMPNKSGHTRYSMDCRFFSGRSTKHYLDMQTFEVVAP